ncbi:zinc-binding dehydrogenase [Nonomuraea sp. 10N515B]|uniref:zinc-binding dehydrogenase n=1 Tax=Nonomuraea sp. 10N515B TaxID=3457422 RepID=UPI003FCDD0EF
MRAIWLTEFGAPSVLVPGEAPDPEPGDGQVLVDVEAASVLFAETQVRAGRSPAGFPLPAPPYVPGNGVGGVISAVGPNVDPALLGRRVIAQTGGSGGYADKAVAVADSVIPIPASVSTADAVALLDDGRTAIGLFRLAAPKPGEWVLVEAAAGGLGSLLVQLGVNAGAKVIGAVGSDAKLPAVRAAGARAVNYAQPGWTEQVRSLAGGAAVDVLFDCVGGEIGTAATSLVEPGGRFVVYGAASGGYTDTTALAAQGVTVLGLPQMMAELGPIMHELGSTTLEEAAAGRLRAVVGQTFPLERAADAHAAIEARTTVGKTLLLM